MKKSLTSVCSSYIKRESPTGSRWGCDRRHYTESRTHLSGLAAYFLDHDARSYALISRVFEGESEGLTRDDILDNITITWLTNTALFWRPSLLGELGANSGISMSRASPSRLPSAYFRTNSIQLRGAGRSRLSQTDPLQQACERRALCGLGTTETLYRRGSRGLQIAAYIAGHGMFAIPSAFDLNKIADSFWRVMFNYLAISLLRPADIVCGPPKSNLLADLRYLLVTWPDACLGVRYAKDARLDRRRFFGAAAATVIARR